MQVFDASSIIYAWDNYPEAQFPKLWHWMADQMSQGNIVMPEVAFKEVAHVAPDCANWLDANNLAQLPMNDQIIQEAIRERNKDNRWFEINAHRWSGTHPRPYGQVRICGQQRAVAHIPKT